MTYGIRIPLPQNIHVKEIWIQTDQYTGLNQLCIYTDNEASMRYYLDEVYRTLDKARHTVEA